MANRSFNLTAELNVRGPSNLRIIAADIRRQLGSINVDINPRINANANRNITNLNNGLRTLNATLAATQTSATNAANAIRNFSQAISSVGTRNINQTLTNAATAAQTLGNNASAAGANVGQAATQMEEFGRQSALAVRRFAAFSIVTSTIYGLINAINGGVKAFISFDKEFVRLQQVTGESSQGLRSLAAEITRLSTSLGVSSEDLTTVSVTLAQAGLSATETRKALQALAKSALAPSFDNLNDTVEGSIALMRQFGISADQLEGALGSVNAVAAKFAVEASDLIAAIQRTGGVFATASRGVSEGTDALNEFLAVFTSIRATTRESAETIATGLRTIFTRIQRQDTIDALQNLGIELRNAQGQFVGAFEAVRRLSQGLSKIDPRSREFAAISEELGGFRQIGKVIPLIQQFATAQQALKVAQTGQASLAEDSVVAQKSVANQIAKVREEFTALIRSIGESESFRSFVRLSLDLASALIRLADSAKTVLPALTAIAAFRGVSAISQFSRGFAGGIGGGRRFATGGYVPGSGNRDTVPAMLTPGEFVIRKKAVQSIGVDRLATLNRNNGGPVQKFAAGGEIEKNIKANMISKDNEYNFGLVGLRKKTAKAQSGITSFPLSIGKKENKQKYNIKLHKSTMSEAISGKVEKMIENTITADYTHSVENTANILSSKLMAGKAKPTKKSLKNALGGNALYSVIGSIFEAGLTAVGSPYLEKTEKTKSMDFPLGLGPIAKSFHNMPQNIPTDATRTIGSPGKSDSAMKQQIKRFIGATEKGYFTQAQEQIKLKKTLPKIQSSIFSKLTSTPETAAQINDELRKTNAVVGTTGLPLTVGTKQLKTALSRKTLGALDPRIQSVIQKLYGKASGGSIQKFAKGGSSGDTVPALLTPGEFVINKKAASHIGSSRLNQLNRADKVQGFNKGGIVGGIQRFVTGGVVESTLAGMSPKDSIRLKASIAKNAQAFEQLEKMVAGWPAKDVEMALKKLDRSLEKGASTADALASTVSVGVGGGGAIRTPKKGVMQQSAGIGENRAVTAPVGPSGFAASQARLNAIAQNTQQYQRGANIVATRTSSGGQMGGQIGLSGAAQQKLAQGGFNPTGLSAAVAKITGALSQGASSVSKFATSVKAAPLATFNASMKQAGSGLLQVGKMGLGAAGKGASGLISKVGGGVLGALGLGGAGRAAGAAGGAAAAGGGMGGMGGMVATMVGGLAIDQISKSLGGEDTEAGRNVSAVGSSTLNMAATGAMIGSVIPGVGTALGGAIGAIAGFTMGMFEAQKANEEYAQNQRKAATEQAMEKSGAAISKFAQTGSTADRAAAIGSFTQAAAAEQALGAGIKRGKGEDLGDFVKKKAATQLAGAEQAEQFLSASMMQSGKTFDELSKTMKPEEFRTLVENIAEADERYVRLQELRNKALAEGDTTTADQLGKEQKELAVELARRKTAEVSAAAAASKAAAAAKSMSMAMQTAALNLERAFDAVGQSLNKISFDIEDASSNIDQIISGQVSLVSNDGQRAANVLANPEAYSAQQRQSAMGRGAQIMGSMGGQAMRLAEFAPQLRNEATRIAVGQQAGGATNEEVGNTIKDTLRRQIEDTFGVGSPMAETAIRNMESNINKAVEEAGQTMTGMDVQSVISDAMAPLTKVSEEAAKTIQQANEVVSQNLKALGEVAQKVAELEQKRIGRTAALAGMQAQTGDSVAEALGVKLSSAQKAQTRVTERATRVGVSPAAYGAGALVQRRQQLLQQQESLTNASRRAEAAAPTNPQAARELAQFQSQLAVVNNTLKDLDSQLEELPQVLQEQIGDVIGEMQARVAQLQAQREAGAGLAEKIVTSTPQELQGMASTYNLLTNTLKGNITTIRDSQVAQKAYFESIRQGKTAQEAMNDAQSAFAEENKKALSMFNELSQVAGIQGPEMDRMRADLISGFAKASGQANNPFIQKMVSELRKDPAQRAANDPQLIAQRKMLEHLQKQQVEATRQLNDENAKTQKEVLTTGLQPLITAFTTAATQITASVDRLAAATGTGTFSRGGMIYASKGKLINFQPKGTDTVPAMLTPGEFVVNRSATQKNLGLLRAINNGQSTNGNYAVGGVVNTSTPTLDQNTINRAVSNSINNFQDTLSNVDKNTSHTRKVVDKQVSTTRLFNRGGVVYASSGKLIKGTDTVPAMLTPGEFVVNRASAKKNLPLLQSINRSKGGPVYLARGGSVLEDELGPVMGDYYRGAIQQAAAEGKWFIANKDRSALYTENLNLEDYSLAQLIEQKNNMASVLAPDGKSATLAATEKYDWFGKNDRVIQASVWYTKKFNKLIQDVKKDKAYLYKEAYDREIGKFPDLFEMNNNAIGIAGNQDAFSEMPELPDPKSKFVTDYIKDKNKAKTINELLQNRFNFLTLIGKNNKEAEEIFGTDPKGVFARFPGGIFQPYKDTAASQVMLAAKELVNISVLMAKTPELQRFPKIANRFEGSRLFDPSDPAVDINYKNIISRDYNRGGVVYASKGRLINFQPKGTDTVPAMLTPGEFVVNRKASQQNAGLLHAINSGNYSSGGPVYLQGGTPMSLDEQRRQRREAYEKEKAMRATAFQARRGQLMTGAGPAPAPAQQRQQPAQQANGFEIKINKEAQDFLTTLTSKIDSFGKYIDSLAAIKIPDKIELNITAQPIEVRITGSAALENMSEGMRNMVVSEVNAKMSEIWSQSGGELGSRPA